MIFIHSVVEDASEWHCSRDKAKDNVKRSHKSREKVLNFHNFPPINSGLMWGFWVQLQQGQGTFHHIDVSFSILMYFVGQRPSLLGILLEIQLVTPWVTPGIRDLRIFVFQQGILRRNCWPHGPRDLASYTQHTFAKPQDALRQRCQNFTAKVSCVAAAWLQSESTKFLTLLADLFEDTIPL